MNLGRSLLNARRNRSQHGAAAVEFAIGALLLITMALGAGEFGLLLSAKHDLNMGVRLAGRVAGTPCSGGSTGPTANVADGYCLQGNTEWDDFKILRAVESGLSGRMNEVEEVVIYSAENNDVRGGGAPPEGCLTGIGIENYCNVYTKTTPIVYSPRTPLAAAAHPKQGEPLLTNLSSFFNADLSYKFDLLEGTFRCDTGPSKPFCPTGKRADGKPHRTRNINSPTSMGVYVRMRHSFVTGLVGQNRTLSAWSMFNLEPHPLANDTLLVPGGGNGNQQPVILSDFLVKEGDTAFPKALVKITIGATPSAQTVTVMAVPGTATDPSDFTFPAANAVQSFPAGVTERVVEIPIADDLISEDTETFELRVTATSSGLNPDMAGSDPIGEVKISDDDEKPTVKIWDSPNVDEDPAPKQASFKIELSSVSSAPQKVLFSTSSGNATQGADFTGVSNKAVTIPAGTKFVTEYVDILPDGYDESNEDFNATIIPDSTGINAGGNTKTAKALILDNDDAPTVSINSPTKVKENGIIRFRVSFTAALSTVQTVDFATNSGTGPIGALSGIDFDPKSGTLTFQPGETEKFVDVQTTDDNIDELDETFPVNISIPSGSPIGLGVSLGTGTIEDDDVSPTIKIISLEAVTEGTIIGSRFQVSLVGPVSTEDIDVTLTVSSDTANIPPDSPADAAKLPTPQTFAVKIPATQRDASIVFIPVEDDSIVEPQEQFRATLSNLPPRVNPTGSITQAFGIINDNDFAQRAVNISTSASVTEPAVATSTKVNMPVTVSLVGGTYPTDQWVRVSTTNGTGSAGAVAPDDYVPLSSQLVNILANTSSTTFNIKVPGDDIDELAETFTWAIVDKSPGLVYGTTLSGTGTIIDNDAIPVVDIADTSVTETNTGTNTSMVFTLTRSALSSTNQTVTFTTSAGTTNPATVVTDYIAKTETVTFSPTDFTKTVSVGVIGDNSPELNETFTGLLSGYSTGIAAGSKTAATGTIIDNDQPLRTVSVNDVTVAEPTTSGTTTATFTITMSGIASTDQTFTVNTAELTAKQTTSTAFPIADYQGVSNKTFTIPAGNTSVTFTVKVNYDNVDEPAETYKVLLTLPTTSPSIFAASGNDLEGIGTITDSTPGPTVTVTNGTAGVNNVTVAEGTPAVFTIKLSSPSSVDRTFTFTTSNAGTGFGKAQAGLDYTAQSVTVTIPAGSTSVTVSVPTTDDNVSGEGDEVFNVSVTVPTGLGTTGPLTGTGTITEMDFPNVIVSVASASSIEGGGAVFTIKLSAAHGLPQTVTFKTGTTGTATSGTDFWAVDQTFTFAPGETSKPVTVWSQQDTTDEPDENYSVILTNLGSGLTLGTVGNGTILDDDNSPTVSVSSGWGKEGSYPATFTVSLSSASTNTLTVVIKSTTGSASAADFTPIPVSSQVVTFAPGQTSKDIPVAIIDDSIVEVNETFTVTLSSPTGGLTIGTGTNTGTIEDNDYAQRSVSVTNVTVVEGQPAVFTVTMNQNHPLAQSVTLTTSDGSATTADSDYVARTCPLNFGPNVTTATCQVSTGNDGTDEPTEQFNVTLSNPSSGITIAGATAIGYITDNDDAPYVKVDTLTFTEGETKKFRVWLERPSSSPISVAFETRSGTALPGSDYNTVTQTLTFAPGETQKWSNDITAVNDTVNESTESFTVKIAPGAGVNLATSVVDGNGTIYDDDILKRTVSINSNVVTVTEGGITGPSSSAPNSFTVTLSGPSTAVQKVTVQTLAGPSGNVNDYTNLSYEITFAIGETTKTIQVQTTPDTADEPDETFKVQLSNLSSGLDAGNLIGNGKIIDDDEPVVTTRPIGGGST